MSEFTCLKSRVIYVRIFVILVLQKFNFKDNMNIFKTETLDMISF